MRPHSPELLQELLLLTTNDDASAPVFKWQTRGDVVAGPATAAGMCAAKGWRSILTPALLVGTFGYATATFVCMALGKLILVKIM
jgi:hypothetical protein